MRVEGEAQRTDACRVSSGTQLDVPQVGTVSLQGVLRSELKSRLQTHFVKFLRDPVVVVQSLVRLLVDGEVARPGYYSAAPQQALADVITQAGGLTQRAKAGDMRVE